MVLRAVYSLLPTCCCVRGVGHLNEYLTVVQKIFVLTCLEPSLVSVGSLSHF